jgi:hypothetical protein
MGKLVYDPCAHLCLMLKIIYTTLAQSSRGRSFLGGDSNGENDRHEHQPITLSGETRVNRLVF